VSTPDTKEDILRLLHVSPAQLAKDPELAAKVAALAVSADQLIAAKTKAGVYGQREMVLRQVSIPLNRKQRRQQARAARRRHG
jgi:hypothetical protein